MGQVLKGTPLSYVSTGQGFFARTTQGDIFCIARSDINSSEVTVIVEDNGAAIAVCDSAAREIYSTHSKQIRRRHSPRVAEVLLGPIVGFDLWGYAYPNNPSTMFRIDKKATRLPVTDWRSEGFVDIDDKGVPHGLGIEYSEFEGGEAFVFHGGSAQKIPASTPIIVGGYLSSIRKCNNWVFCWPDNAIDSYFLDNPPHGWTVDLWNLRPDGSGLEMFTLTGDESELVYSARMGTMQFSGTTPTYPGGPTYPFSYEFEGVSRSIKEVEYSEVPAVVNIGPIPNPDPDDDNAAYDIYQIEFGLIGGITTPERLIINATEHPIWRDDFTGFVNWSSRVVWDTSTDIITFEYRGTLYEDFVAETASLFGQTGVTTEIDRTTTATYTLPILVDIASNSMIAETYSGTVKAEWRYPYTESGDPPTSSQADRLFTSDNGTEATFLLKDGIQIPVDGYWQHQFYIRSDDLGGKSTSEIQVGDIIRLNRKIGLTDAFVQDSSTRDEDALEIWVPGREWGHKRWRDDDGIHFRQTHNTPRADHEAALMDKLSVGARVYGVLYDTAFRYSTVYKGIITSSSIQKLEIGGIGSIFRTREIHTQCQGSQCYGVYHLGHLEFEVTELVAPSLLWRTWDFFGDYWHGKCELRFANNDIGSVILDGSIRNMFPTEAYNSTEFAHRGGNRARHIFSEGTFLNGFVGTNFQWADPYIWRFYRDYKVGHWEAWVQGRDGHPAQVPRWKLDYSGPVVKCWFDGIDEFELMPPDRSNTYEAYDMASLGLDRKMALKRLEQQDG